MQYADAGRDYRTRLERPSFQARTGTGKKNIFPVQLTTRRIGNFTRLILTLTICDDHTYYEYIKAGKLIPPVKLSCNRIETIVESGNEYLTWYIRILETESKGNGNLQKGAIYMTGYYIKFQST